MTMPDDVWISGFELYNKKRGLSVAAAWDKEVSGSIHYVRAAAREEIESASRRAEYWKAEHNAANAEIARLRERIEIHRKHMTAAALWATDDDIKALEGK